MFYEETSHRAERMAKDVAKFDRHDVREARLMEAVNWIESKLPR